jgi:hypothetical protein
MASETHELSLLLTLQDRASQGLSAFVRNLEHSHQAAYRSNSVLSNLSTTMTRGVETGRLIGDVWRRQYDSLHVYTDEAMKLLRAQEKFKAINLSPEENKKAFDAVRQTVQDIKGTTFTGVTENLTDLHTAIGNLHEAIGALPVASKFRFNLETYFSDKFSPEEIEGNIRSGFKFLEMVGAIRATGEQGPEGKRTFTTEDHHRMEEYFNRAAQMTAATGGRVTPNELLQMAQTGGTALQGLSLRGLTNLSGVVNEISGTRTGTALQTLFQQVVAGRIQQKGLVEWQRLGLLDTKKVEFNKSGIVKRMSAGAIPIGDYLQEDPMKFADALRDAMQKHGVDTNDPKAVIKELGALKMPRTAMEITSLFINQRDRMMKEAGITEHAKGITGQFDENSELAKYKRFEAAMTNFRASVGTPMLEWAGKIADKLTPLMTFFGEHPRIARWTAELLIGTKALSGFGQSLFYLKASGLLGAFGGMERSIGGVNGALLTTEKRVGGLSGTISRIPTAIKIGFTLLALDYTTEKVLELMEASENLSKANQGADRASKDTYTATQNLKDHLAREGKPYPDDFVKGDISAAISSLNRNNEFVNALDPTRQGWWEKFATMGTNPYANTPTRSGWYGQQQSEAIAANELRGRTPMIHDPDVMRGVRSWLDKQGLNPEARAAADRVLKTASPTTYERVTGPGLDWIKNIQNIGKEAKPLTDQLSQLSQPVSQAKDSFTAMNTPLLRLPGSFSGLADAAESAAGRLSNIETNPFHPEPGGDGQPKPVPSITDGIPKLNLRSSLNIEPPRTRERAPAPTLTVALAAPAPRVQPMPIPDRARARMPAPNGTVALALPPPPRIGARLIEVATPRPHFRLPSAPKIEAPRARERAPAPTLTAALAAPAPRVQRREAGAVLSLVQARLREGLHTDSMMIKASRIKPRPALSHPRAVASHRGGDVHIGDVHVHVHGGDPKDARQIARDIKRELKKELQDTLVELLHKNERELEQAMVHRLQLEDERS